MHEAQLHRHSIDTLCHVSFCWFISFMASNVLMIACRALIGRACFPPSTYLVCVLQRLTLARLIVQQTSSWISERHFYNNNLVSRVVGFESRRSTLESLKVEI